MSNRKRKHLAHAVLDCHGTTYASELGIDLTHDTPSPLFRWLCASLLFSARIGGELAMHAAKALFDQGWTTPQKLAETSWEERVRVLNHAGYARYDESTARMLGDTTELLLEKYKGDLRKLRDKAGRDPDEERRLLKEFKGIGDVGVDIFFREVQIVWDELFPFADKKSLAAAKRLDLGDDAKSLSQLVDKKDLPRLLSALVRTDLAKDYDAVAERAA